MMDSTGIRELRDRVVGSEGEKIRHCTAETLVLIEKTLSHGSIEEKKTAAELLGSLSFTRCPKSRREIQKRGLERLLEAEIRTQSSPSALLPFIRAAAALLPISTSSTEEIVCLLEDFLLRETVDSRDVFSEESKEHSTCTNEIFSLIASLSIKRNLRGRFQTQKFFEILNAKLPHNPYWVFTLFSILISEDTLPLIDINRVKEEVKKLSAPPSESPISTIGYIAYGLIISCRLDEEIEEIEIREDPQKNIVLPWNVSRRERLMGTMVSVRKEERKSKPNYELYDIIDHLMERKEDKYSLIVLSRVVKRSTEAQKYVKERKYLREIMEDFLKKERIKYLYFINECIGRREENRKAAMESGFIGEVLRRVEESLNMGMITQVTLYGIKALKLITRSGGIVKNELTNYPVIEILERVIEEVPSPQGDNILVEALLTLSNILLINSRWKSIFINRRLLSKIKRRMESINIRDKIFLLFKNLLYEDDSKTKEVFIEEMGISFLKLDVREEKVSTRVEYYGIVRNIICNNKKLMSKEREQKERVASNLLSIVPHYVKELERELRGGGAFVVKLELLYILVNISSLNLLYRLISSRSTLSTILGLMEGGEKEVVEGCLWFIINVCWARDRRVMKRMEELGFITVLGGIVDEDTAYMERVGCAIRGIREGL